jgi:peptidoglycan/xylan/chitin deacetylase (PgdA/CDA1 family)
MNRQKLIATGIIGGGGGEVIPPVTLPQFMLTSAGTLLEGFNNFADWTLDSGTIANDAVNFREGTASLKLTTAVGGSGTARKSISVNFGGSAPHMRLSFYLAETYAQLSNVQVRVTSAGSAFTTNFYASIGRGTGFHTGWNTIDIYPSDWTATGAESWSNTMNRLRVQAVSMAGQVSNVSVDALYWDVVGQPAIILTFDDCLSSLYATTFPLLKSKGIVATCFAITDNLGTAGYCTTANIQEIFSAGWTVGNHTTDHTNLTGLTEPQCETKIGDAKTALTALGITTGDHVALPFNGWNENTLTACRNLSIKTARQGTQVSYPRAVADQIHVLDSYVPINTTTLAAAKAWVDEAKTKNTPVWLQFHDIVTSPSTTYQWATQDLSDLVDYIKAQSVRMITVDEFYRTLAGTVTINHW